MTTKKKVLGQFFTTNYSYILQGMSIPDDIKIINEPFTGNGDLLKFIPDKSKYQIHTYDIDPKLSDTIQRDTLLTPPEYKNSFILTNPPYLARNKSEDKTVFNQYKMNDLFKCFLYNLTTNTCLGGIVIVPLNFWSSIRKMDVLLRKKFLQVYAINRINVFEEKVFTDTSYSVCSFQFTIKKNANPIPVHIFPSKITLSVSLESANSFSIGGYIYSLPNQSTYTISRLLDGQTKNTNIVVKCIDDNKNSMIGLKIVDDKDIYIDKTPNHSARTYATLTIMPELSLTKQKKLVSDFNTYLGTLRDQYHSLFLANYRESNTIARKRISFDLVYQIVGYLLTRKD
jgi:hypothetical protein